MAQKQKKKRVNLSRNELMNREFFKTVDRNNQATVVKPSAATLAGNSVAESKPEPAAKPEPVKVVKLDPLLLTVANLCELLNVSRSTVVRLENSGALPGRVDLGGSVRYHREIIEAWIRSKAV